MTKSAMIEKPDPWRVPVAVEKIPDTGLHRDLEADQATRVAVADIGGLREVLMLQASFDVTPQQRRPLSGRRATCGPGSDRPAW